MTTGEEEAYVCRKLGITVAAAPQQSEEKLEKEKGVMDFSWLPDLPDLVLPAAAPAPPPPKKKKQQQPKKKKTKTVAAAAPAPAKIANNNTLVGFIQYIAAHVFFGAKALKEMPPPNPDTDEPALYADKILLQNALDSFTKYNKTIPQVFDLVCDKIKAEQNFDLLAFVQLLKEHKELVLAAGNVLKIPAIPKEMHLTNTHIFILNAVHLSLHLAYYIKRLVEDAIENEDLEGHGLLSGWQLLVGVENAKKDNLVEWNSEETPFAAKVVHVNNVIEEIKKWK